MSENKTDKDMLRESVEGKAEYLRDLLRLVDDQDETPELYESEFAEGEGITDSWEAFDRLSEVALSVDMKRIERVCFTVGGPNIFVDVEVVEVDHGYRVTGDTTLVAGWGFDRIEEKLTPDNPLADAATRLVQYKLDCEQ